MLLRHGRGKCIAACALALCFASTLWSGPKISVDETEFDAGTIIEGEKKKITHVFTEEHQLLDR